MTKKRIDVVAIAEQEDEYEIPLWVSFVQHTINRLSAEQNDTQLYFSIELVKNLADEKGSLLQRLSRRIGSRQDPKLTVFLASPFFKSLKNLITIAQEIKTNDLDSLVIFGGKEATLQTRTKFGLTSLKVPLFRRAKWLLPMRHLKYTLNNLGGHRQPLIDVIVRGDAENTFKLVMLGIMASYGRRGNFRQQLVTELDKIKSGIAYYDLNSKTTIIHEPARRPTGNDLDEVYGWANHSGVDPAKTALIYGGSGTCPFHCVFCLEHLTEERSRSNKRPLSERSIKNVADELNHRLAAGQRELLVVDSLWHGHSIRWKEDFVRFFEEKAETYPDIILKIFGHVQFVHRDYFLIQRLAKATELSYFVGIENINQDILDKLNKSISVAKIYDALAKLKYLKRQVGINISIHWGYIMVSPWDSFASIRKSNDFLHEHGMMNSVVLWGNILGIYPTVSMLRVLFEDGLLINDGTFGEDLSPRRVIVDEGLPLAKYAHGDLTTPDPKRSYDSDLYRFSKFLSMIAVSHMKSDIQRMMNEVAKDRAKRNQFEQLLEDFNSFNFSMFELFVEDAEGTWRNLSYKMWRKRAKFLEAFYLREAETTFKQKLLNAIAHPS